MLKQNRNRTGNNNFHSSLASSSYEISTDECQSARNEQTSVQHPPGNLSKAEDTVSLCRSDKNAYFPRRFVDRRMRLETVHRGDNVFISSSSAAAGDSFEKKDGKRVKRGRTSRPETRTFDNLCRFGFACLLQPNVNPMFRTESSS